MLKSIKLVAVANSLVREGIFYKVIVVKNTTNPIPGSTLEKNEVDSMCASQQWDVTIVSNTGGK